MENGGNREVDLLCKVLSLKMSSIVREAFLPDTPGLIKQRGSPKEKKKVCLVRKADTIWVHSPLTAKISTPMKLKAVGTEKPHRNFARYLVA